MTMITPSYLGETIEYSSLHACRSTLEDPTLAGVKAATWENEILNGTRKNLTVCRVYNDVDTWNQTESFRRYDLPLVAEVVDQAHTRFF